MDAYQMELVPANRKAMMSVVIPAWYDPTDLATDKLQSAHPVGVLSIDTTTPLEDTGWTQKLRSSRPSSELGENCRTGPCSIDRSRITSRTSALLTDIAAKTRDGLGYVDLLLFTQAIILCLFSPSRPRVASCYVLAC
jgi:hypothetical protein